MLQSHYRVENARNIVIQSETKIPVVKKVDVLVAGGGTSGAVVAIAAARIGVHTMVIEKYGFLGGMLTAGYMTDLSAFYAGMKTVGGITQEIVDRLEHIGRKLGQRHTAFVNDEVGIVSPNAPQVNNIEDEPGKTAVIEMTSALKGLSHGSHDKIVYEERGRLWYDVETMKYLLLDMAEKAGADLLLHTLVVGSIVEDNQIKGVIIEGKSGRQAILADIVVDCTGDADIAAFSGAPFEMPREGKVLPVGFLFSMDSIDMEKAKPYLNVPLTLKDLGVDPEEIRKLPGYDAFSDSRIIINLEKQFHPHLAVPWVARQGHIIFNWVKVHRIDGTNSLQLSQAEVIARKAAMCLASFLIKYVPGFENAYLQTATTIGVRETRRIVGEYTLSTADAAECRKFEDSITKASHAFDLIDYDGRGGGGSYVPLKGAYFYIPYRCLIPKKIDNLIVAGRCISTSRATQTSSRSMSTCMSMGEAAGTAAAISVKEKRKPREIRVSKLQERLVQQGANVYD